MAPLKLHYFALPGRAEVARLCLTVGKLDYEEVRYDVTWLEHKSKFPFGQLPVLELADGTMIAQSGAIDRYTAKLAGLYPEDPLKAALADQAAFLLVDLWELFAATMSLSAEEKIKARQEILAGKGKDKLLQISKLLEPLESSGGYVAGDKLSFGDLSVFVGLSNFVSGFLDGIPPTLLDDYPVLKAFHNKIASLPAIKAYYEKDGEGLRAAYKPRV